MAASYLSRYVLPADPRLGRQVNHDPKSRRYARRAADVPIRAVHHVRHVPIFQQLNLGRCVPTAGLGCLGTGVFFAAYRALTVEPYPLSDEGAIQAYRDVTRIDPFEGEWEPDDTGSDGLSMAKLLVSKGVIPGYTHAFALADFLGGLMSTPCIVGTEWTGAMSSPDADCVIKPSGVVAGGHEYVADEVVTPGQPFGPRGTAATELMVGFTNSWGDGWGHGGRFFMTAKNFGKLLKRDGDATFFTPSSLPAPEPELPPGVDEADVAIAGVLHAWLDARGL